MDGGRDVVEGGNCGTNGAETVDFSIRTLGAGSVDGTEAAAAWVSAVFCCLSTCSVRVLIRSLSYSASRSRALILAFKASKSLSLFLISVFIVEFSDSRAVILARNRVNASSCA